MISPSPRRHVPLFLTGAASLQTGLFVGTTLVLFLVVQRSSHLVSQTVEARWAGGLLALLLALPLGVLVDRVRRRSALVTSSLLSALALGALTVALWQGWTVFPLTALVLAVLPLLRQTGELAQDAFLPALVGRDRLIPINAILAMVGPVLWLGFMFAEAHLWLMAIGTVAFAVCALSFRAIDVAEEPAPPRTGWWREMTEGVRFTCAHPVLRAIALYLAATELLEPLVDDLIRRPAAGPAAMFLLEATAPAGAVAALLLHRRVGGFRLAWAALLVTQPFAVLLLLSDTGWGAVWHTAGTFVWWAGATTAAIALLGHRQAITPARLLGRTGATLLVLTSVAGFAGSALRALAEGLWRRDLEAHVAVWPVVTLAVAGLVAAVFLLYRVRALTTEPAEPSAPAPPATSGT
ncbi:hypothetical protein HII36_37825 [Nonomuraea sp. NN258]|uniref:hypothetical protein n=1 Tax=Nonomuraea antri TaxID=2730852 RepID=UPI00156972F9|nr:hypothetical protein [Nonomuraea antri]NRQ37549.1 hypothetical protein [Nonomuraea antri]